MAEERGVWEIRLGLWATESQADEIQRKIRELLCPDPEHTPPCPIPWSVSHVPLSEAEGADDYPELIEQARAEGSD